MDFVRISWNRLFMEIFLPLRIVKEMEQIFLASTFLFVSLAILTDRGELYV